MAKAQMTAGFIDDPSPYDSLETWERHLAEMKRLPPTFLGRRQLLAHANDMIRRIRAEATKTAGASKKAANGTRSPAR